MLHFQTSNNMSEEKFCVFEAMLFEVYSAKYYQLHTKY